MKPADKDAVMGRFRDNETQVLVATTVIEVGVDVPNATVMIVMDADRFGLSQLHQLRGRVGRGEKPAQVFLVSTSKSEQSLARLAAMERTDDGFELAKYDLSLRRDLQDVRARGIERVDGQAEQVPDWDAMRAEALEYAKTRSTNNDWGVEDGFYSKALAPVLDAAAGSRANETYSDTPEYDDLAAFLQVANECGIDVMVVICPEMGP